MTFFERHQIRRVVNALGTSTIVGASVAPPEVIAAASEALAANCEIDELQSAACRAIAKATGAEAGCVTSSASSGIAIATAACMTAADLVPRDRCVTIAGSAGVPVIVDAAAEPDVRPFLSAGASIVISSGHKAMGAPTSGRAAIKRWALLRAA